jgi:hypothetical protein
MAQPQAALGLPGIWETWPEPDSSNWALALTKASYHATTAGTSSSAPAPAPTANGAATAAVSPLANGHDDAATPSPVTPRPLAPSTSTQVEARSSLGLNEDRSEKGGPPARDGRRRPRFGGLWWPPPLIRAGDGADDGWTTAVGPAPSLDLRQA